MLESLVRITALTLAMFALGSALQAGAQPIQHSVTLRWVASATPGVEGYRIYRAPCKTVSNRVCAPAAEGKFDPIGESKTTSYKDINVQAGASYSYYIKAFCPAKGCAGGAKGESAESTHVGALIPTTVLP